MNFTVLDTTAPVANITGGPSNPSDSRNATFNFTANENDVTFQCKINTGDWLAVPVLNYTNLSDDFTINSNLRLQILLIIRFCVTWIWKINDLTGPISSYHQSDNITNSQSATFAFSSNEDDSSFECKLIRAVGLAVVVKIVQ